MELEKQEKLCNELDKIIYSLENEIVDTCKIKLNLKTQLEDMEKDELLTMAWLSAYPNE